MLDYSNKSSYFTLPKSYKNGNYNPKETIAMITIAVALSAVLLTSMVVSEQANPALKDKLKEKVDKVKDKVDKVKQKIKDKFNRGGDPGGGSDDGTGVEDPNPGGA